MKLDRRTFLKTGAATCAFPLIAGRLNAFANPLSSLAGLAASAQQADRILLVIRLDGGNDGLSTVLPLDKYDILAQARPNILIPAAKGLKLDAVTALHPTMPGLQQMYLDGKVKIVQAVGYPNHNQSHFRSTDIWFTASDYNQVLESGWLGRYLDGGFPNYPAGYPNPDYPDPPAMQIGSVLFTLLEGAHGPMGMAVSDPASLYSLTPNGVDTAPDTPAGHELAFIRLMASQTQTYGDSIRKAMAGAANKSTLYPATGNRLADQLKSVARLIAGGLKTRIYVASLGGFDTHANQVDGASGDTTVGGRHAVLLAQLSEALAAFQDDLKLLGVEDRVVGLTISEFGRRILSNASFGTDHGTSSPLFVFGKPVAGGVLGASPQLPATVTVKDNIPMQYDFRSVYSTLLKDWLGVTGVSLQNVMLKDFPDLPLLSASGAVRPPLSSSGTDLEQNVPNPCRGSTSLGYRIAAGGNVTLRLFDTRGNLVRTLASGFHAPGVYRQSLDAAGLPPGTYVYRLEAGPRALQRTLQVMR